MKTSGNSLKSFIFFIMLLEAVVTSEVVLLRDSFSLIKVCF